MFEFTYEERRARDARIEMWAMVPPDERDRVLADLVDVYLKDQTAYEEAPDAAFPARPVFFETFSDADAYQAAVDAHMGQRAWARDLKLQAALLRVCLPLHNTHFSPWFHAGEWGIRGTGKLDIDIKPWANIIRGDYD